MNRCIPTFAVDKAKDLLGADGNTLTTADGTNVTVDKVEQGSL